VDVYQIITLLVQFVLPLLALLSEIISSIAIHALALLEEWKLAVVNVSQPTPSPSR
jgi:hypothetical protein